MFFPRLFGGGIKKLLRTASITGTQPTTSNQGTQSTQGTPTDEITGPANWLNKQRVKLNTKLLGHQPSQMKEDKPTYREQFIPPEMSILAYLLTKVGYEVVVACFNVLFSLMPVLIVMISQVILKVRMKMCLICQFKLLELLIMNIQILILILGWF